jgi:hypothetical protein
MIVKSEMINGKLYFVTEVGEVYRIKISEIEKGPLIERLANITRSELNQMLKPNFLKFVDRFEG